MRNDMSNPMLEKSAKFVLQQETENSKTIVLASELTEP